MDITWPAPVDAGTTTLKIYRSLTKRGSYTELAAEIAALSGGSWVVTVDVDPSIGDNRYYYKVAYCDASGVLRWSQPISYETENATTQVSDIVRRVRRFLGDLSEEVYADTLDIYDAIVDALGGFVAGDLVITPVFEYGPNAVLIGFSPDLDGRQLHAASLGVAITVLEGEYVASARDAVSTESPAGRINTTSAPEHIRRALNLLYAKYNVALSKASSFDRPQFLETSDIATTRGFVDMTSDYLA